MLRNVLKNKVILLLGTSMMLLTLEASALQCDDDQELVVRPNGSEYCEYYGYDYPYYAPFFLPFVEYGWEDGDEWGHDGHDGHWGHEGDGHEHHEHAHAAAHGAGAHGGGMHGGGMHGGGHGGHH